MCSNKIVRMADLPIHMVVRIFSELNRGKLIIISGYDQETIVTDTNPKYLTYPDGWYFESGVLPTNITLQQADTVKQKL